MRQLVIYPYPVMPCDGKARIAITWTVNRRGEPIRLRTVYAK